MSQENVEIVRAMFDAYSAGDMDLASCTTPMSSCGPRRGGQSRDRLSVGMRSCASSNSFAKPLTPPA